jgi:flagellar hook assembly protein FlgD
MINWDGKDNKGKKVAAGTYFINLEIDGISEVEKVVLIE